VFNRERLLEFMSGAGLDAVVAGSPENVRYLSGYSSWGDSALREWMIHPGGKVGRAQQGFAVITDVAGAGATLLVPAGAATDAVSAWASELRTFGPPPYHAGGDPHQLAPGLRFIHAAQLDSEHEAAGSALAGLLQDLDLSDGAVGIDTDGLDQTTVQLLAGELPRADLRGCSNLLRLVRMVKTGAELRALERAAEVNEHVAAEALRSARAPASARSLRSEFAKGVLACGAGFDHFAVGLGGLGAVTEADAVIETRDVVCVDHGCRWAGYYADAGVTFAFGVLPRRAAREYEVLRATVLEIGLSAVRPGVVASTVYNAMARHLEANGVIGCFAHGHGLGLEPRDYPILVPDTGLRIVDGAVDVPADVELEQGMVLNLEAALFTPGAASLEVEITLRVTANGARLLIDQDRSAVRAPG
jgi:Xaa-Pro aminopeptidase